jgi:uncharacterized protein
MNNNTKDYHVITYEDVKNNKEIRAYINSADKILGIAGYTKHDVGHVAKVAETAAYILKELNYEERDIELAKIAGITHDIGNMINRHEHAQTGALLAFQILRDMGMSPEEIFIVTSAIGNHDEGTGQPISVVSAALILGDKVDVRRSRVRNNDFASFDIHDRVNYAVEKADIHVNKNDKCIQLELTIDTKICSLMEYFEIFLNRMMLCRKAADFLESRFELVMNGTKVL